MKRNISLLLLLLLLISACKQTPTPTVDLAVEETSVNAMVDLFDAASLTDSLASFLTEDALVTGTAPGELWTKQQMVDMWHEYFSGNVPEHSYTGIRTVKVAKDGNSATVNEEYMMPVMSSVLQARNTLHLVKQNNVWMIDFISIAFIPANEDLPAIEKALTE